MSDETRKCRTGLVSFLSARGAFTGLDPQEVADPQLRGTDGLQLHLDLAKVSTDRVPLGRALSTSPMVGISATSLMTATSA